MMLNKKIGNVGEALAVKYLKEKSYQIKELNYTNKIGEIDIIAVHNDVIVFIEVKNRTTDKFGVGREAVNFYKQQKIRSVAQVYLKYKKLLDVLCRFDVIEITGDKIEHIENAF